jgi:tRNA (guanosine-2'-O-)-methyltransferase
MTPQRKKRIHDVVSRRQQGILVLEDIHDPHNAAACLRSADAFGFQVVYFIAEKEQKFNPRKIGSVVASSGNKWLDFKVFASTKKCMAELKRKGYETIATVVAGKKTESFFNAKFLKAKVAVLLGNEHRGLSRAAVELSDRRVTIPMQGMVESLNLSVTTTLFLSEITRQRMSRGMKKYLLEPKDRKKLKKDFMRRGAK